MQEPPYTRNEYIKKCWDHARHHWLVAVVAGIFIAFSIWTEYFEPWVEAPVVKMHKKLPLLWAMVVVLVCLVIILIEGGVQLHAANKDNWDQEKAKLAWENAGLAQKLARAVSEPSGPELMIDFFPPDISVNIVQLLVINLRDGTAHHVQVHPIKNAGLELLAEPIPYIPENEHRMQERSEVRPYT
jgi:succinate dehydrogenase hydrophobic anchor subunit